MSIKIPVQAVFDQQSIASGLNKLGQQIAIANKTKFDPIPAGAIKNMDELEKRFQKLLQLNREMARRVKVSGQSGNSFLDLDWGKLYDNDKTKSAKMAQAFQFVTGAGFSGGKQGGGNTNSFIENAKNAATNAAHAGLNATNGATGGFGGVASGALNRGMSAGFGAGLMGLVGGALALGISKVIGSVTEKMDEAEANAIANDRLKRALGDVTVSFGTLESSVRATADQTHVLYSEAAKLTGLYAKTGNIGASEYRTLAGEAGVGIGMSKSFGIDPSQGVNTLAQFRGLRLTNSDQDTRRMALLIGETIGKSDAFAKSAEVMDAIAGFATNQTRMSLGAANVGGYAGLFSSMVGSGIAGLDPQNSAGILSRIIGTLQQGGGAGEASQFFSSMVAERNGLNPIAGSVWRESPLSSVGQAFGGDTAVGRYLSKRGVKLPGGSGGSFYSQTMDQLKQQYKDPWMLLEASSRHLGISKGQAAAMLDMQPNQMGELEGRLGKDFDISKLKGEAIATMAKVLTGDQGVLTSVAGELRSRTGSNALNADERKRLDAAMSSGDMEQMKQTLLTLTASRGQEQTQGKDIHDSKVAIENLKTLMASQLIPLTQDMRAGILYLAGKDDGLTGVEVLNKIAEAESKSRIGRIEKTAEADKNAADAEYQRKLQDLQLNPENSKISHLQWFKDYQAKVKAGTATAEDKDEYLYQFNSRERSLGTATVYDDGGVSASRLKQDRNRRKEQIDAEAAKAVEKEASRLSEEKKRIDQADSIRLQQQDEATKDLTKEIKTLNDTLSGDTPGATPASFGVGGAGGSVTGSTGDYAFRSMGRRRGGKMAGDAGLMMAVAAAEKEIGAPAGYLWAQMGVESNYNPNAVSPAGAMGLAQVMPGTLRNLKKRSGRDLDPFNPADAVFIQKEVMKENYGRFGNWDDAARAYNGGWNPRTWGNSETSSYVPKIRDRMRNGTAIPEGSAGKQNGDQRFILDAPPIEIIHRNERGQQIMPSQTLATTLRPASPFGTSRYS